MNASYIDYVVKGILNVEGGFVNKKADRGGATKYGITIGTLSRWRKKKVTVQDVMNLTKEEAATIYKEEYIRKPGFLNFGDEPLAEQLIDAGVNHGQAGAIKILQRALDLRDDGVIGPQTIAAVKALPFFVVYAKFISRRLRYYAAICDNDSKQLEFAAGWMNRCATMIRRYCQAVNAPDAFEDKLERVAKFLNSCANIIGKKKRDVRAISWFMEASALALESVKI